MAYSVANLSATRLARAAADLPMLVGDASLGAYDLSTAAMNPSLALKWAVGGSLGGTDVSDSTRPTKRAFDDDPLNTTRPTGTRTDDYLCGGFEEWSGQIQPIDTVAIIGHNLGELAAGSGGDVSVRVQVSNASDFATVQTIASWDVSLADADVGNRRLVCTTLGGASHGADPGVTAAGGVYTSVEYIRVWINHGGSALPEIGRIYLGRRQALPHVPNRPWDSEQFDATTISNRAHGVVWLRERFTNRKIVDASWTCDADAYVSLFRDWFDDIGHGARTGLWIQSPASALAEKTYLVKATEPTLEMPNLPGARVTGVSLALAEVPPFALTEWQL